MSSEDFRRARTALDNMDDYARMDTGVDAYGPRTCLEDFIRKAEAESVSQYLSGYRDAVTTLKNHLDKIDPQGPSHQRPCPIDFSQLRLKL